jgi:polyhydroxybutyrate depolymerase
MLAAIVLAAVAAPEPEYTTLKLKVDGVEREALVYTPPKSEKAAALVFCWHGHSGTMKHSTKAYPFAKLMPDAVSVYPQGLPTPGITDPDGLLPGWQKSPGDQKDRDLKFFDALLSKLKADHRLDEKRIYSLGHSNGGALTYLLWRERPSVWAAVAPSAAGARNIKDFKPLPCLHVAGKNDKTVSFTVQEFAMRGVKAANKVGEGKPWTSESGLTGTLYPAAAGGADFVTLIHDGDHKYPAGAPKLIAKFFAEHAKP